MATVITFLAGIVASVGWYMIAKIGLLFGQFVLLFKNLFKDDKKCD